MKREVQILTPEEIEQKLSGKTNCKYREGKLELDLDFDSYREGIEFVNLVAKIAEDLDHHPEITIGYKKVRICVFTHSHSSITHLDFELMERIEALYSSSN
jgi:4a-hydroxytetrahydrobiopterin dehydratase